MLEVFRSLTSQINAIALGTVQRVYTEIRLLVESLLSIHMTSEEQKLRIPDIVKALTEQYTHDYPICRTEAKKLGLKAKPAPQDLEFSMMKLFGEYETDLQLQEPFNPEGLLQEEEEHRFRLETAYVESIHISDAFIQEGILRRQPVSQPPQSPIPEVQIPTISPVMVTFISRQWEIDRSILKDTKGSDICTIKDFKKLERESRMSLEELLDTLYFIPNITKITRLDTS